MAFTSEWNQILLRQKEQEEEEVIVSQIQMVSTNMCIIVTSKQKQSKTLSDIKGRINGADGV